MEINQKYKFLMSEPIISYTEEKTETSSKFIKNVNPDPESKIVEILEVSTEFSENLLKLQNSIKSGIISD